MPEGIIFIAMYYRNSREKRNHAAILYHLLLLDNGNLDRFLELIGHKPSVSGNECEVYYEFNYLKDHWYAFKKDNEAKKEYLLGLLPEKLHATLKPMDPLEWNRFFAARPVPSSKRYQSPARWSPGTMPHGIDKDSFAQVSRLKWCFNVKPDLVIQTGDAQAVCIETKFDSLQTSYQETNPAYPELEPVTELHCHRYMFEHLIGPGSWQVDYVLLSRKQRSSKEFQSITWHDVFEKMDPKGSHAFVSKWLRENEAIRFAEV